MRKRLRARCTVAHPGDEEGSVLILTLGYAVFALVTVLVCVDATSLYLAQKRLDGLADAASLAAADGFTLSVVDGEARAELTSEEVHAHARSLVTQVGAGATLVSAESPDGVSARVTVADVWRPPVLTLFAQDGVALRATATSRTALR